MACTLDPTENPSYKQKIDLINRQAIRKLTGDGRHKDEAAPIDVSSTSVFVRDQAGSCFSDKSAKAQTEREKLIVEQMRLAVCGPTPPKGVSTQEVNQIALDLGLVDKERIKCTVDEELARFKVK
jgi:hypothetical protein